jgi:ribosomal protein S12 methylthiotransferase
VEGASANALPNPVPEAVKEERYARFMERARDISARRLARRIGQQLTVLVDTVDATAGTAVARTAADAPEIDGVVRLEDAGHLAPGAWAQVQITGADAYDLTGRPLLASPRPTASNPRAKRAASTSRAQRS